MRNLIQDCFKEYLIFEDQPMKTFKESIKHKEVVGIILKKYATDFANSEQKESIFKEKKKIYKNLYIFLSTECLDKSKILCVSFLPVCSKLFNRNEDFYYLTHHPEYYRPELVDVIQSCHAVGKMQEVESGQKIKSGNYYQNWEIMQAAELMQSLSQDYSAYLKNTLPFNPEQQVIDLSVHKNTEGKIYCPLIFGSTGTPWHNAPCFDQARSFCLKPSCELEGGRKKSSELKLLGTKLNLSYYLPYDYA